MRKDLDIYASVALCKNIEGYPTRHKNVDFAIIRENTEGEYSGLEHQVSALSSPAHSCSPTGILTPQLGPVVLPRCRRVPQDCDAREDAPHRSLRLRLCHPQRPQEDHLHP